MTEIVMNRGGARGEAVTIAATTDTSDAFNARAGIIYGVIVPAGFDGASISFLVSIGPDDPFFALNDELGSIVTLSVSAGEAYTLPAALAPWPYFKIVSGSTESADRTLRIVSKR